MKSVIQGSALAVAIAVIAFFALSTQDFSSTTKFSTENVRVN